MSPIADTKDAIGNKLGVSVLNLDALSSDDNRHFPLRIPPYQRPYAWGERQVRQLLHDLREAYRDPERKKQPYLMGTLILHKTDGEENSAGSEIVDGQQRLITLSLLLISLNTNQQIPLSAIPRHGQSLENLQDNKSLIDTWLDEWVEEKNSFQEFVRDQVHFLVIPAPTLDDAFTFFDSQNSRGKPLAREDLLKAHHLRHLARPQGADEVKEKQAWEEMERGYVRDWEQLDLARDGEQSRLRRLLHVLIGSARLYARHEFHSLDVLDEFRAQLRGTRDGHHFRFNRYQQPPIFKKWRQHIDADGPMLELFWNLHDDDVCQCGNRLRIRTRSWLWMPFRLTQALEGGEQMFWFLEKYDKLEKELFVNVVEKCLLWKAIRDAQAGFNGGEIYLKSAFDAAMLFYYDKFETEHIDLAAVHFEHFFFHLRLAQSSVRAASLGKLLRTERECSPDNKIRHPFYLIEHSASPAHLFEELTETCERLWKRDSRDILDRVQRATGRSADYWTAMYGETGSYKKCLSDDAQNDSPIWKLKRMMRRAMDPQPATKVNNE